MNTLLFVCMSLILLALTVTKWCVRDVDLRGCVD